MMHSVFAQNPKLVMPIGHERTIGDYAFSPSGKHFVTVSGDLTAKIWDVATGRLLSTLIGHSDSIHSVAYTASGKYFITSATEHILWNGRSGEKITNLEIAKKLLLSPIKDEFVAIDVDSILHWRITDKGVELQHAYQNFSRYAMGSIGAFSKDGKMLWTADGNLTAMSLETGELVATYNFPKSSESIVKIVMSPVAGGIALLAKHEQNYRLRLFNIDTSFNTLLDTVLTDLPKISFDQNGTKAFVGDGKDKTAFLYDLSSKKTIISFNESDERIISFNQDGTILAVQRNNQIELYNTETGGLFKIIETEFSYGTGISKIAFTPDGKKISSKNQHIFDVNTGRKLSQLESFSSTFDFALNNSHLAVTTLDGAMVLDLSFKDREKILLDTNARTNISLSDNQVILSNETGITLWDFKTGQSKNMLPEVGYSNILSAGLDPKGSLIALTKEHILSWRTPSIIDTVSYGYTDSLSFIKLSEDKRLAFFGSPEMRTDFFGRPYFATKVMQLPILKPLDVNMDTIGIIYNRRASEGATGLKWRTDNLERQIYYNRSPKLRYVLPKDKLFSSLDQIILSSDGKTMAVIRINRILELWDTKTTTKIAAKIDRDVLSAAFSKDSKLIIVIYQFSAPIVYRVADMEPLFELTGTDNPIISAQFTPDQQKIVTKAVDGSFTIWNNKGKRLCTLYVFNGLQFLAMLPSGYYMCSPGASKSVHYVSNDLDLVSFEQLDLQYNRPDKFVEEFNGDTTLIKIYKKAYEKRLKKLGVDSNSFSSSKDFPVARIVNEGELYAKTAGGIITLKLNATATTDPLERYNVWINETPLFGSKGKKIAVKNRWLLDTTITVELSSGKNIIEFAATNSKNLQSLRIPLHMEMTGNTLIKPKLYFVGIGIDQYQDSRQNLRWSKKDIRDQLAELKLHYGENLVVDTLFDQRVTLGNLEVIRRRLATAGVNDKVIIAYSGHGILSNQLDYFLATYKVDFQRPALKGLAYETLEGLVDGISPRQKLLMLDACHSGEIDKEDIKEIDQKAALLSEKKIGYKGVKVINTSSKGLKSTVDLMNELFSQVSLGIGTTVIAAASGTQYAIERNDLQNGVFTYSAIEYYRNTQKPNVSDLKKYLSKRVTELTNGLQIPAFRAQTNQYDWNIW